MTVPTSFPGASERGSRRGPGVREISELLRDVRVLRSDPHATDLDWLRWFEAKAELVTCIAEESGSPEAAELAVEAWAEVDRRRALLDLDPHDRDNYPAGCDAVTGGVSGRW